MALAPLFTDLAQAPDGGVAQCTRTKDGTRVRFAVWRGNGRGTAVIFPGRTECIEKYGRMVGMLVERGFDAVVIDWRGQGLSEHTDGRRDIGDVRHFTDYQQDVTAVMAHEDVTALPGPRYLFAHSMGGCIALRTLIERNDFDAAILSAPMWGIYAPKGTRTVLSALAWIAPKLGLGKMRVPSSKPGSYVVDEPFEGNTLTGDLDHWNYMRDQIVAKPELGLGGPTLRWLHGALQEFTYFKGAVLPSLPILAFVGGREQVVDGDAIRKRARELPDCTLIELPTSQHEIWMETPDIQERAWAEIDAFLQRIS